MSNKYFGLHYKPNILGWREIILDTNNKRLGITTLHSLYYDGIDSNKDILTFEWSLYVFKPKISKSKEKKTNHVTVIIGIGNPCLNFGWGCFTLHWCSLWKVWIYLFSPPSLAHSARAVECTNRISAEGSDLPHNNVLDMTLNNLMRL